MTSVAFQGASGAYSELALRASFGAEDSKPLPCQGFSHVFEAVSSGSCDFGIVPLENALTGSIHENFDLFLSYPDLSIGGEFRLRIRHSLIARPEASLSDIREVRSHPQGLAQCAKYLSDYPEWKQIPYYDTAGSVEMLSNQNDVGLAAIASSYAASRYNMKVLAEGIETNQHNYTRFGILQRPDKLFPGFPTKTSPIDGGWKASVVFGLADRPGTLLIALQHFALHQMNLTKIESRPIHGKPFEYMFYSDVDSTNRETDLVEVIEQLKPFAKNIRLLGNYPVTGDI